VSLTRHGRCGGTSAARLDTRTDDSVSGAEQALNQHTRFPLGSSMVRKILRPGKKTSGLIRGNGGETAAD